MISEDVDTFHRQHHAPRRVRKLDRVRQNVDQHLLELHVVADVEITDTADHPAFIVQSLFLTLRHDHGVDLLQHIAERKRFLTDHQSTRLDPAHIQNIVDEAQKMMGAFADLFQVLPGFGRNRFILQSQTVQSNNRVHRSTDLMAHVGQEGCLGYVGFFSSFECFT